MKTRMVLATLTVVLSLAGCGGGGGGGGDSAVPATGSVTPAVASPVAKILCPDGESVAVATDFKPLLVASVSVAEGGVVSPDSFKLQVKLTGAVDPASLTAENIALWAGTAGVPGNVVKVSIMPSDNGFVITPAVKLAYGQTYVGTVKNLTDTLGRPIPLPDLTFSTTAMVCSGLTKWSDDYGTCIVPLGVQLVGVSQMQDPVCTADQWTWGSECFRNAVRNGTVQVAESTALAGGKPLIAALFADAAGAHVILAFDVTDKKNPVRVGGDLLSGLAGALVNWAIPNPTFLLTNLTVVSGTLRYQFYWDPAAQSFAHRIV